MGWTPHSLALCIVCLALGCAGAMDTDGELPHNPALSNDGVEPLGCGPDGPDCADPCPTDVTGTWQEAAVFEAELLALVNGRRAELMDCGGVGSMGPSWDLVIDPILHKVARCHAVDMANAVGLTHIGSSGGDYPARARGAGFDGTPLEELGAGPDERGQSGQFAFAVGVFDTWRASDEHCGKLMEPDATEVGVGYYRSGDENWWVLVTAAP